MLDGGVSDSIPLKYFQSIGFEKNLVVLTQPRSYRKSKNSLMPLIKVALRKYPKLVDAMARRHEIYNETLDYIWDEEKKGNVFVLCPDEKLPIKRTEHDEKILKDVYDLGRVVIDRRLEDLKEFLGK